MHRPLLPLALTALLLPFGCDSKKDDASGAKPEADAKADAKAEIAKTEAELDAKAAQTPPEEEEEKVYGGEFCATIIPCFQKLEFSGNFSANVSVDIEPDGSVSAVSFTGEAPTPVQTCITDTIKGITLTDYNGKPGRARCSKSGQLMGGTQMVMSDSGYELREAGEAEAEGAPEGDAKAEPAPEGAG